MAPKDRLSRIREHLDPEEQTLLTLRVDRGFSFGAIAGALGDAAYPILETGLPLAPLVNGGARLWETLADRRRARESPSLDRALHTGLCTALKLRTRASAR